MADGNGRNGAPPAGEPVQAIAINGQLMIMAVVMTPSGPNWISQVPPTQALAMLNAVIEDLRFKAFEEKRNGESRIQLASFAPPPPVEKG